MPLGLILFHLLLHLRNSPLHGVLRRVASVALGHPDRLVAHELLDVRDGQSRDQLGLVGGGEAVLRVSLLHATEAGYTTTAVREADVSALVPFARDAETLVTISRSAPCLSVRTPAFAGDEGAG